MRAEPVCTGVVAVFLGLMGLTSVAGCSGRRGPDPNGTVEVGTAGHPEPSAEPSEGAGRKALPRLPMPGDDGMPMPPGAPAMDSSSRPVMPPLPVLPGVKDAPVLPAPPSPPGADGTSGDLVLPVLPEPPRVPELGASAGERSGPSASSRPDASTEAVGEFRDVPLE